MRATLKTVPLVVCGALATTTAFILLGTAVLSFLIAFQVHTGGSFHGITYTRAVVGGFKALTLSAILFFCGLQALRKA